MLLPSLDEPKNARIRPEDKGLPQRAVGLTVGEFLATGPKLSEFWTPLVVLDDSRLRHNVSVLADWCAGHGFELMPHGKTTMAPLLWRRQLEAGATGITLATMGQVRAARGFGFDSIMLANELVFPDALRYIAGELADPDFEFHCWADSVAGVEAMDRALAAAATHRPLNVCVDLGWADNGRTGVRTVAEAVAIADRIERSSHLRLTGIAAYEGTLAHDRSAEGVSRVRRYLESVVEFHDALAGRFGDAEMLVTIGGSAFFDVVAEILAPAMAAARNTRWVLRSGAYITHDEGFYQSVSPLDAAVAGPADALRPAARGLARVISHPEPGLSLLDGGKRDFPYDEDLPVPLARAGSGPATLAHRTTQLADQHAFVRGAEDDQLEVGTLVWLGLSHPCTTFDKWRIIPVVAEFGSEDVVELVQTYF